MVIDWKYPKYMEGMVKEIEREMLITVRDTDKNKQALSCLLYNIMRFVSIGRTEIAIPTSTHPYSIPLIYNGTKIKRKISHRAIRTVLEWMTDTGLVSLTKGGVTEWQCVNGVPTPASTVCSQIQLSNYMLDLVKPYAHYKPPTMQSKVEVRSTLGIPLTKRLIAPSRSAMELLEAYNTISRDSTIILKGKQYSLQLRKVYNTSYDLGGRNYYHNDPLVYSELLRKESRGEILINGDKTVEMDYKSLHLNMLAEMEGVVHDNGFDPYQIRVNQASSEGARALGKLASLVLINAGDTRKGMGGFVTAVRKNNRIQSMKAGGDIPYEIPHRDVIDAVIKRNPYISKYLSEPVGLTLQNKDSKMMDIVIGELNRTGDPCITLHDSVRVVTGLEERVEQLMVKAYSEVMGSVYNCIIEEG